MKDFVVDGEYLHSTDTNSIMVGSRLLAKYSRVQEPGLTLLDNVELGDKVQTKIGPERYSAIVSKISELEQIITSINNKVNKDDEDNEQNDSNANR